MTGEVNHDLKIIDELKKIAEDCFKEMEETFLAIPIEQRSEALLNDLVSGTANLNLWLEKLTEKKRDLEAIRYEYSGELRPGPDDGNEEVLVCVSGGSVAEGNEEPKRREEATRLEKVEPRYKVILLSDAKNVEVITLE